MIAFRLAIKYCFRCYKRTLLLVMIISLSVMAFSNTFLAFELSKQQALEQLDQVVFNDMQITVTSSLGEGDSPASIIAAIESSNPFVEQAVGIRTLGNRARFAGRVNLSTESSAIAEPIILIIYWNTSDYFSILREKNLITDYQAFASTDSEIFMDSLSANRLGVVDAGEPLVTLSGRVGGPDPASITNISTRLMIGGTVNITRTGYHVQALLGEELASSETTSASLLFIPGEIADLILSDFDIHQVEPGYYLIYAKRQLMDIFNVDGTKIAVSRMEREVATTINLEYPDIRFYSTNHVLEFINSQTEYLSLFQQLLILLLIPLFALNFFIGSTAISMEFKGRMEFFRLLFIRGFKESTLRDQLLVEAVVRGSLAGLSGLAITAVFYLFTVFNMDIYRFQDVLSLTAPLLLPGLLIGVVINVLLVFWHRTCYSGEVLLDSRGYSDLVTGVISTGPAEKVYRYKVMIGLFLLGLLPLFLFIILVTSQEASGTLPYFAGPLIGVSIILIPLSPFFLAFGLGSLLIVKKELVGRSIAKIFSPITGDLQVYQRRFFSFNVPRAKNILILSCLTFSFMLLPVVFRNGIVSYQEDFTRLDMGGDLTMTGGHGTDFNRTHWELITTKYSGWIQASTAVIWLTQIEFSPPGIDHEQVYFLGVDANSYLTVLEQLAWPVDYSPLADLQNGSFLASSSLSRDINGEPGSAVYFWTDLNTTKPGFEPFSLSYAGTIGPGAGLGSWQAGELNKAVITPLSFVEDWLATNTGYSVTRYFKIHIILNPAGKAHLTELQTGLLEIAPGTTITFFSDAEERKVQENVFLNLSAGLLADQVPVIIMLASLGIILFFVQGFVDQRLELVLLSTRGVNLKLLTVLFAGEMIFLGAFGQLAGSIIGSFGAMAFIRMFVAHHWHLLDIIPLDHWFSFFELAFVGGIILSWMILVVLATSIIVIRTRKTMTDLLRNE
ncbi:MAG: hypothetical protein ACFFD4_18365 [Candidatus Odinarchaeota archaeon]